MWKNWPFRRKVVSAFSLLATLTVLIAALGIYELRSVVTSYSQLLEVNASNVILAEELKANFEHKVNGVRGFMLTTDGQYRQEVASSHQAFRKGLVSLLGNINSEQSKLLIEQLDAQELEHQKIILKALELTASGADKAQLEQYFTQEIDPRYKRIMGLIEQLLALDFAELDTARADNRAAVAQARNVLMTLAAVAILISILLSWAIIKATGETNRVIEEMAARLQSASQQLQSAASQQAAAASEQSSAITEVSTTLTELSATSREMAQGTQQVASISGQALEAADQGNATVRVASKAIVAISEQVDLIVQHMLGLSRQSQQIGGVLGIINELTEQTGIVAINASIESAGAGEAGRRFAVVADEIRKLSTRVRTSTNEIQELIEQIQAAANKTVMVTETGAKAVAVGVEEFDKVSSVFSRIGELVGTTTDAIREIELGTGQQVSAVEQVGASLIEISQAARESEATARETVQTAQELDNSSGQLVGMIRDNSKQTV